MSVTYLIEFDVIPEQRQRFLVLLDDVLDAMRSEPEFENATLHVDPDKPNHFLLHETWNDHQNVIDVQIGKQYREAFHCALPEVLSGPRRISIWTPLRADRAAG